MATQGSGSDDESRLRELLSGLPAELGYVPQIDFFAFDHGAKAGSFARLFLRCVSGPARPDLVVMEGTGVAGGAALILARCLGRARYVVSSGDAVGPFVGLRAPALRPFFALYERALCRLSAGFIGWSPYLAGRALSFGAGRAMTASGWAPFAKTRTREELEAVRLAKRAELGIPASALVIGIAGSLRWSPRVRYCYGLELVKAFQRLKRNDVYALIVGGGDGSSILREENTCERVKFTGQVPRALLPDYLAAFDIASLPQSVDGVGAFRYTTKLSEYLAAGLPVVTTEIPLSYDLPGDWLWRLPGDAPWDPAAIAALVALLESLTPEELARKRAAVPRELPQFQREHQTARVAQFLRDQLRRCGKSAR